MGLAAVATGLSATRGRAVTLPSVLLLPAVLLLALLLQFGLQRLAFPQIGLLYAAYLLWAGMLMIFGRHLAATVGLIRLADVLAGAACGGSYMQTPISANCSTSGDVSCAVTCGTGSSTVTLPN